MWVVKIGDPRCLSVGKKGKLQLKSLILVQVARLTREQTDFMLIHSFSHPGSQTCHSLLVVAEASKRTPTNGGQQPLFIQHLEWTLSRWQRRKPHERVSLTVGSSLSSSSLLIECRQHVRTNRLLSLPEIYQPSRRNGQSEPFLSL